MVALYWLENFLLTYWFMREVFPTPESPRMMTLSRTFLRPEVELGPAVAILDQNVLGWVGEGGKSLVATFR